MHSTTSDREAGDERPRVSAVILTRNEANNIAACINSIKPWVDLIVVWDSGSNDDTRDIARRCGAHVVYRPFDNYAAQRQSALDSLNVEWVLFVDADERFTAVLGQELKNVLANPDSALCGAWLPRRNFIAGKEVRGGGFYPDYQLRLLRRGSVRYVLTREVHEIAEVDGQEIHLQNPLLHYNYESWSHFRRKQPAYARYEASILAKRGIHARPHNFVLQPLREFRRRFFTLHGYRDGLFGLRLALALAWYYGALPYYYLLRDPTLYDLS